MLTRNRKAGIRLSAARILWIVRWIGLIAIIVQAGLLSTMAQDNKVTIQVLNGKNGKPIVNQHLLIFEGGSQEEARRHKSHIELRTDAEGKATFSPEPTDNYIQVWVDWHILCQKKPNVNVYSMADIINSGLTTGNSCGRIERPVIPKEFLIFARPAHFWEKMSQ